MFKSPSFALLLLLNRVRSKSTVNLFHVGHMGSTDHLPIRISYPAWRYRICYNVPKIIGSRASTKLGGMSREFGTAVHSLNSPCPLLAFYLLSSIWQVSNSVPSLLGSPAAGSSVADSNGPSSKKDFPDTRAFPDWGSGVSASENNGSFPSNPGWVLFTYSVLQ